MQPIERHPLVEEVLGFWQEALGTERAAYRGHVYRVLNYARALVGSGKHDDALAVASAFHDLGIWSDRTFDYLLPSIQRGETFRRVRTPSLSADLLARMIDQHHRLRRVVEGPEPEVVEAFRRADLVDVSRGVLRPASRGSWSGSWPDDSHTPGSTGSWLAPGSGGPSAIRSGPCQWSVSASCCSHNGVDQVKPSRPSQSAPAEWGSKRTAASSEIASLTRQIAPTRKEDSVVPLVLWPT